MFPCEACGHPMNAHNPCHTTVGKGKRAKICGCAAFQPEDLRVRVAELTDNPDPRAAIAAALAGVRR